jgi:hypothetical protein
MRPMAALVKILSQKNSLIIAERFLELGEGLF